MCMFAWLSPKLTVVLKQKWSLRDLFLSKKMNETSHEEEEKEQYRKNSHGRAEGSSSDANDSKTIFSKWFMVLQESQNSEFCKEKKKEKSCTDHEFQSIAAPSNEEQEENEEEQQEQNEEGEKEDEEEEC